GGVRASVLFAMHRHGSRGVGSSRQSCRPSTRSGVTHGDHGIDWANRAGTLRHGSLFPRGRPVMNPWAVRITSVIELLIAAWLSVGLLANAVDDTSPNHYSYPLSLEVEIVTGVVVIGLAALVFLVFRAPSIETARSRLRRGSGLLWGIGLLFILQQLVSVHF